MSDMISSTDHPHIDHKNRLMIFQCNKAEFPRQTATCPRITLNSSLSSLLACKWGQNTVSPSRLLEVLFTGCFYANRLLQNAGPAFSCWSPSNTCWVWEAHNERMRRFNFFLIIRSRFLLCFQPQEEKKCSHTPSCNLKCNIVQSNRDSCWEGGNNSTLSDKQKAAADSWITTWVVFKYYSLGFPQWQLSPPVRSNQPIRA